MKTAMILAAGRGERLKPLTEFCPKSLCKVHNIPIIEHHVLNLVSAGFEHLIINHAYLGGKIRQHLGNGARFGVKITYSPEPPGGLETGGGIVNALPLLGDKPFLTVNADIFTDYDFSSFSLPAHSLVHLILVSPPKGSQGDFGLTTSHEIENSPQTYTFSGVAAYRPEIFQNMKNGRYSITPLLRQLANNKKVTGEIYQGIWIDIGTPERLRLANQTS